MERIVVGVDGSDNARAALQFARDEAALRGAVVDAVYAWHRPYMGDAWTMPMPVDIDAMEKSYRAELEAILASVPADGVEIRPVLAEGAPAQELLARAEGASLLVVGSRGHGGFLGLLLGSVSHQVAAHAPCPVVIVPDRADG